MIHYGFIESIDLIFRNFSDRPITFGLPDSYPNTTSRSLYKKLICRAMPTYEILKNEHLLNGMYGLRQACGVLHISTEYDQRKF